MRRPPLVPVLPIAEFLLYLSEGVEAHRHTVLVVEDDYETRDALMMVAQCAGLTGVEATNGREALERLRDGVRPCLIVLDIAMPEMDGFEFRRAQQVDPALAPIPVAVVSAAGWVLQKEAQQLGLIHFLRKPIDIDELLRLVAFCCNERPRKPATRS